ncbi:hypothetical protein BGW80DRAFT_1448343 [Lactifluus volemus]|nr:hypothetical protein BGW80DRAFT_1448343 [Lactifluus volemus]
MIPVTPKSLRERKESAHIPIPPVLHFERRESAAPPRSSLAAAISVALLSWSATIKDEGGVGVTWQSPRRYLSPWVIPVVQAVAAQHEKAPKVAVAVVVIGVAEMVNMVVFVISMWSGPSGHVAATRVVMRYGHHRGSRNRVILVLVVDIQVVQVGAVARVEMARV